jgi:hypothetical protein
MDDTEETRDLGDLNVQVKSLRSGSTRLRTEVLRRIVHTVESVSDLGTSDFLRRSCH